MPDWPRRRKQSETPFKDDLSGVLKQLMQHCARKMKVTRKRLANDELTREYMEAGLRLGAREFSPSGTAGDADSDGEDLDELSSHFFHWLSRKNVIAEVARGKKGMKGSDGTFRDRWPYQSYFIRDLLSYALYWRRRSADIAQARHVMETLSTTPDLADAIQQSAYQNLLAVVDSPAQRVALIAITLADRVPQLKEVCGQTCEESSESWTTVYAKVLKERNVSLRPDISLADFTCILTALSDGLALRQIGDPNVELIDHKKETSLLGKAVWLIVAAAVDSGDGKRLAEIVDGIGGAGRATRADRATRASR